MNYKVYKLLQTYVHAGYSREKNILLREFGFHIALRQRALSESYCPSVLELACGGGNLATIFPAESYLGIDFDASRIKVALLERPEYSFKTCDINRIDFEYLLKDFDFIFCYGLLHHIDDNSCRVLLDRIKNIALKPTTFVALEPILPVIWKNPLGFYFCQLDKGHYTRSSEHYKMFFGNSCLRTEFFSFFPRWPVNMGVYIMRFK